MQEICAEANISAGALYRYFASKADIIAAIAEDHRGESDVQFLRTAEKEGLVPALCLAARNFFLKFAQGDGALIADIFAECIRDDALCASLRVTEERSVQLFTNAIAAAQARGEIDVRLDAADAADTLFATIEGIGLRRAFRRETDPDAAVAQFCSFAERYLSPRP